MRVNFIFTVFIFSISFLRPAFSQPAAAQDNTSVGYCASLENEKIKYFKENKYSEFIDFLNNSKIADQSNKPCINYYQALTRYTPHIGKLDLYRTSGHFPYYRESQFPPLVEPDTMDKLKEEGATCADLSNRLEQGVIKGFLFQVRTSRKISARKIRPPKKASRVMAPRFTGKTG